MVDLTIIVFEGALPTAVSASLDILDAAARLSPQFGIRPPRWRVCSIAGGEILLRHGLKLDTEPLMPRDAEHSTWILPGMGTNSVGDVDRRLLDDDMGALSRAVAAHGQRGGVVAASCASVFVLQAAGLLDGRRATTTWWLAPHLQRLAPTSTVDASRMVCADEGIVTAGAAFAQVDLMLHLLRDRHGPELATAVSRYLLVDARYAQSRYVVPEVLANGDHLVAAVASRVRSSVPTLPSIADIASENGVSERTLHRRIQKATGYAPLAFVNIVRIQLATEMLRSTTMSVEQVAAAIGYADSTALHRMTKRALGIAPGALRG